MQIALRMIVLVVCVVSAGCAQDSKVSAKSDLSLELADGGSMVTELGSNIAVNKGSSLRRRLVTLNASECPVKLVAYGVKPVYKSERYSGSYSFVQQGSVTADQPIVALQITIAQFDVWGRKMRTLSLTEVRDFAPGPVTPDGSWYASENDVSEFRTSAAFVDQVMTADGFGTGAGRKAGTSFVP